MSKHYDRKMIVVDGAHTYLLSSWVCDEGVALMVSGPETILLHQHKVTEPDGSELKLEEGVLA
jgi:hypothetical protein